MNLQINRKSKFMETPTESDGHDHYPEFVEHREYRNYMRDLILGGNDGLVSLFALVIGVAAGVTQTNQTKIVLLAGIAGAVAGSISMAIGEFLSTKSQEQVYDSEKELEKTHIKYHLEHEKEELYEFYRDKGFEGEILDQIVNKIASDPDILLKEMMMAEFGVLEEERRSPYTATAIVGLAFFIGSILPIIPFVFVSNVTDGIIFSGILSAIGLFTVGGIKSWFTKTSILHGGLENLIFGLVGAAITYTIGHFVGVSI